MRRAAGELNEHPEHTHLRAHQALAQRLGNHHGIKGRQLAGAHRAGERGHGSQRAVAGVLFFEHRVEADRAGGLHAEILQRLIGGERADDAGLHVARAAAEQPAVLDKRCVGRLAPHRLRTGGDHVQVAIEQHRAAALLRRTMRGQQVVAAAIRTTRRREQRQVLKRLAAQVDALRLQAKLAQRALHEGHGRLLLPGGAGRRHERRQRTDHVRLERAHGGGDGIGGKCGGSGGTLH